MNNKDSVVLVDKDSDNDFFGSDDKENTENASDKHSAPEVVSMKPKSIRSPMPLPDAVIHTMRSTYREMYECPDRNHQLPSIYFLIGDGEVVNAHQGLLRLYSPHIFRMAIENGNMIQLDESTYTRPAVQAVVKYLYFSEINITRQNCQEMYNFARFMQLDQLCQTIRFVKKQYSW